jgi:phage portal protein BeeE
MKPLKGGDTVYLQQQNYSLAALSKRDSGPDPFGKATAKPAEPSIQAPPEPTPIKEADQTDAMMAALFRKSPRELIHA